MIFIDLKRLILIYFFHLFVCNANVLLVHTIFGMVQMIHIIWWYVRTVTAPGPRRVTQLEAQLYQMALENDKLTRQVQHLQNELDEFRYTADIWEQHMMELE